MIDADRPLKLCDMGTSGIRLRIPGKGEANFVNVLSDFNGTLATDGRLDENVKAMIEELSGILDVHIATAGTHGGLDMIRELPVRLHLIERGEEASQKLALLRRLGIERTVVLGNGANDVSMLEEAELSIVVVGGEGAYGAAVRAADIVVTSGGAALGLLLAPARLVATLRR